MLATLDTSSVIVATVPLGIMPAFCPCVFPTAWVAKIHPFHAHSADGRAPKTRLSARPRPKSPVHARPQPTWLKTASIFAKARLKVVCSSAVSTAMIFS